MKNEEYREYRLQNQLSVYVSVRDDAGLRKTGQELFDGLAAGSFYGLCLKSKRYLDATSAEAVSYTHLTLPTIYSV